ncbi:uncharacterized protein PG986_013744 [Apiospora aurea]|uniref:Type I-U CRISPR-associated protein Csx17 n=1 Tax=Apiospora aurea TaxID=335848 RepID=A0ABR1PWF4_9PEZI
MSAELINNVIAQGQRLAIHSWEYGTFAEALLEWHHPQFSVFGPDPFPNGKVPVLQVDDVQSLSYAKPHIWTNQSTLVDGDGAAGDPASLGVSAILIGQTQPAYLAAAGRQVDHLLTAVPRWPNGAISHREAVAELWADFVYMAPPALAYWAAQTADAGLLAEVLRQCSLYRDVLGVPLPLPLKKSGAGGNSSSNEDPFAAGGLWHHIIGPETQDLGIWSTGNAWAAAGMTRVLATALKFPQNSNSTKTKKKSKNLDAGIQTVKAIVRDILDAAIALDQAEPNEPLLRNYLNDTTWFGELSGTTLLTATVYRLAVLAPDEFGGGAGGDKNKNGSSDSNNKYVQWADAKRPEIIARVNAQGLLSPVINPLNWGDRTPGTESPEAQAFALLMFAAWRDYQEAGRKKGTGTTPPGKGKDRGKGNLT